MQWCSLLLFVITLTNASARKARGIPCVSFTGSEGTCRHLKYCWVSTESPQPAVAYCSLKVGEDPLVCCPDERPLRPIEQACLDYSHVFARVLPTTTPPPTTTTLPYNTTSTEGEETSQEDRDRDSDESSEETLPETFRIQPHLVKIGLGQKENIRFKCTGTIITHRYILSSAACIESPTGRANFVWLGHYPYYQSTPEDKKAFLISVKSRILYNDYSQSTLFHDVGLLHLKKDIKFNYYIRPACVNVERGFGVDLVTASEWDHLQERIQIFDHKSCNNHFRLREIDDSEQFCAELRNNCGFSTGSPLQVPHPHVEMTMVVGLLSFRKDCLRGDSLVAYTRTSAYASWIEAIAYQ